MNVQKPLPYIFISMSLQHEYRTHRCFLLLKIHVELKSILKQSFCKEKFDTCQFTQYESPQNKIKINYNHISMVDGHTYDT